jgi:type IV fimbrial biogenesis protein FimT
MKHRGLTLLELMIALAVLAIVASLTLPSFSSATERARLKSAAQTLAADLAEARFEAAQRGQPLYIDYGGGNDWCWAVATAPGCSCGQAQACQLKTVRAGDHAGIALLEAGAVRLDPAGATEGETSTALFQSSRGESLRVELTPLGRTRICTPQGNVSGYPPC